ncbi:sodium-dependent bicarbonate transport family permease [Rhodoluna limnophila]|uniref:sodium-dependent bicarbonate transport family permease n=1 Tax=Rhodoluna limnophila TaxID=232537 RepID=UPI001106F078|nr:sodium-dependent bicarbonate transport family permease [Rhodoluna limnophila]
MPQTLELALANLSSPPVLAFVLGLLVVVMRSQLSIPKQIFDFISIYLLLAIGLKGGVALRTAPLNEIVLPLLLSISLGIALPLLAFVVLRRITRLSRMNRGALAAHYGSTSLVTFTAGLVFIEQAGLTFEGFLPSLLAVMEVPGLAVGILLAKQGSESHSLKPMMREVFTGKSIVLLVGGIALGAITGATGFEKVEPFFGSLFSGMLTIFLLQLGIQAGQSIREAKSMDIGLVAFAVMFPFIAGSIGVFTAQAIGMSQGGSIAFGLLCGSASYIAAPAAVKLSLPEANQGLFTTAALGVTFPVNLILGIPWLAWVAEQNLWI